VSAAANIPVAQAFRPEGFHGGDMVATGSKDLTPEGVSYKCASDGDVGAPTFPIWNCVAEVAA